MEGNRIRENAPGRRRDRGISIVETVASLALLATVTLFAAPAVARLREAGRGKTAARRLAAAFAAERVRSIASRTTRGLYFEKLGDGTFTWRDVTDGNGNGLRTAEIRSGADPTVGGPHRIGELAEHVRLGFPGTGPFPAIPPGTGTIPTSDPVQFGASDIVSFSPLGSASSGTIYLTEGSGLFAVVLYGPTARVRVLRYDAEEGTWVL